MTHPCVRGRMPYECACDAPGDEPSRGPDEHAVHVPTGQARLRRRSDWLFAGPPNAFLHY